MTTETTITAVPENVPEERGEAEKADRLETLLIAKLEEQSLSGKESLVREGRLEMLLQKLEGQSALQTVLAKKRLLYARLSAAFLAVTAVTVLWMVGRVIPEVESTLDTVDSALQSAEVVIRQLDESDIPAILENLDNALTECRQSMDEASVALQKVSSIDFGSLNKAIHDLQGVLENPLGSLVSGWRK